MDRLTIIDEGLIKTRVASPVVGATAGKYCRNH
jgi:hypothetical protein